MQVSSQAPSAGERSSNEGQRSSKSPLSFWPERTFTKWLQHPGGAKGRNRQESLKKHRTAAEGLFTVAVTAVPPGTQACFPLQSKPTFCPGVIKPISVCSFVSPLALTDGTRRDFFFWHKMLYLMVAKVLSNRSVLGLFFFCFFLKVSVWE